MRSQFVTSSWKYIGLDEQIMLLFEYISRLEEAKQQEMEHANRKRIGFRKQDEDKKVYLTFARSTYPACNRVL